MRLPCGYLDNIRDRFLGNGHFVLLGCLSFEERCLASPTLLSLPSCQRMRLLEVVDPTDAFPDHSVEAARKMTFHKENLRGQGIESEINSVELLASEDTLLAIVEDVESDRSAVTVVLDITSLPKRFFCFFLKRFLMSSSKFRNVLVTYTDSGPRGYTAGHLAEDPMQCEHLPGFAPALDSAQAGLVVAVGFESLGIRSVIETYGGNLRDTKIIMSFPPNGEYARRQWRTLMDMVDGNPHNLNMENIRVIAAWDAEEVYFKLNEWLQELGALAVAPFGAKTHTLGMALFSIQNDCGIFYTQPKSYNPNYSLGKGQSWAYIVKWQGIPCYDRQSPPF